MSQFLGDIHAVVKRYGICNLLSNGLVKINVYMDRSKINVAKNPTIPSANLLFKKKKKELGFNEYLFIGFLAGFLHFQNLTFQAATNT